DLSRDNDVISQKPNVNVIRKLLNRKSLRLERQTEREKENQTMADLERAGTEKPRANSSYNPNQYYVGTQEHQWTSWLIPMFVVANIIVFIVAMFVNNCPRNNTGSDGKCVAKFLGRLSFQPLRENPLFGPSSSTLEKLGALKWSKVVHGHQGWRLVTCMWLHAGVIHLLANMLSLIFIGIRLEQQFGFVRVGIIYLLSGLGGSILSALFIQSNISVGASGALFGLLGAMLSELLTNWSIYTNKAAALLTLIVIIAINLAVGILPHVDNFAHIGGFLAGFLLGFILLLRPQFGWMESRNLPADTRVKSKHKPYQHILLLVASALLIAGIHYILIWFKSETITVVSINYGIGVAVQRRELKQALQLVPLPKLCANLKMEIGDVRR
ncbi:RHOMBOID-like 2, partial [Prunus dulcis]